MTKKLAPEVPGRTRGNKERGTKMKFGVIGFGNMGSAIVKGAVASGVLAKEDVMTYDIKDTACQAATDFGIEVAADNEALCKESDVVLLAVKPQQMEDAMVQTKRALKDKALFSILPGVSVERLRKAAGTKDFRVLRLLPNTPALVFEGAFACSIENDLSDEEKAFATKLFESIGVITWVKTYDLDAACGLSGGGPAYVAMFIEALADGGVKEGLTRPVAYELAIQTVLGSAKLLKDTGMHPGQLKDMVTSPAGTTIEGCQALEDGGFRAAVSKCVSVATKRSREL